MTRQISYIIFTSTYKLSNAISAEGLVLSKALFEKGFGAIIDIEVEPMGIFMLFQLVLIFRIFPSTATS